MDYRRLMVFVDGSNFLIELGKHLELPIRAENPPATAFKVAQRIIRESHPGMSRHTRSYWVGSYQGSEEKHDLLRDQLRGNGFEPILFRKKDGREKGVDIALTKEMLVNAFHHNFEAAVLVAGDEDYLTLVQEAKRYGGVVWGAFFIHGLSPTLKVAFDAFRDIGSYLDTNRDDKRKWKESIEKELLQLKSGLTILKSETPDQKG